MKRLQRGNIYSRIPRIKDQEIFQTLLLHKKLKIERIVSQGQSTPKGEWLIDARAEWVMVLTGSGTLRFQRGNRLVKLKAGDYVFIPANVAHRVEWTDPRQKTIWLAVRT